jgi:hypothetical protein
MKSALMTILGIIVGMGLALVLVIGVEWFSSIVHPLPVEFNGSMEEMCQHVARYPHWVLGVVVLLWGVIAFLAVWGATRIGRTPAGGVVAFLLLLAVVFNVAMLPYPAWFKVVMPIGLLGACGLGIRRGRQITPVDRMPRDVVNPS